MAIGVNMHLAAVLNIVRRWQMVVAAGNERRTEAFARSMESVARDGVLMAADVGAGAFMHPLGANRAYDLVGQVALGLEPALS